MSKSLEILLLVLVFIIGSYGLVVDNKILTLGVSLFFSFGYIITCKKILKNIVVFILSLLLIFGQFVELDLSISLVIPILILLFYKKQ